jgi:hypothetical protein
MSKCYFLSLSVFLYMYINNWVHIMFKIWYIQLSCIIYFSVLSTWCRDSLRGDSDHVESHSTFTQSMWSLALFWLSIILWVLINMVKFPHGLSQSGVRLHVDLVNSEWHSTPHGLSHYGVRLHVNYVNCNIKRQAHGIFGLCFFFLYHSLHEMWTLNSRQ